MFSKCYLTATGPARSQAHAGEGKRPPKKYVMVGSAGACVNEMCGFAAYWRARIVASADRRDATGRAADAGRAFDIPFSH